MSKVSSQDAALVVGRLLAAIDNLIEVTVVGDERLAGVVGPIVDLLNNLTDELIGEGRHADGGGA